MANQQNTHIPAMRNSSKMHEAEFPALWKTALQVAHGHRNVALSMMVRLVRRHIEVAASERERRLTGGETDREKDN
jgi:hypothetical protein